ncbi:ImmA/IrrE family metallo-endopeptidase [Tsukamurella sp. 1534]|uniref:helix-turn-helix domain-containing protein n=1 Tax=Tsukamurella sp. 1534 TaxID=1151061 RepID=UPI0006ACBA88
MRATVNVYGRRVRQARIMRKMTAKALAAELGWPSAARLTRLEKSITSEISTDELEAFTTILRFPPRFFTTEPPMRIHPSDLLFRAPQSTTKTEQEYLTDFASMVGEFLDELHSRWQLPAVKIPMVDPSVPVAEAAGRVRDALGVGRDEPIDYLTHNIEHAGVPIVMRRMLAAATLRDGDGGAAASEKHLGYSTRVGEFKARPLIVVRQSTSWERTRWTLAHELGHLSLHWSGDVTEDKEEQASRFASELLAPLAQVRKEVTRTPSLMSLVPVKQKWGISIGALLRHLHTGGVLDDDRFRSLQKQLYQRVNPDTGRTWGRTEPGWDDRAVERPRLLSKWIELGFSVQSPQLLATYDLIFPGDILADFLVGQRPAPSTTSSPTASSAAAPSAPAVDTVAGARGEDRDAADGSADVIDFRRFQQRSRRA